MSALRRGGWPLPRRALEPLHDFAAHALGVGSAHLDVATSGEAAFLQTLANVWREREHVHVVDVGAYAGAYTEAVIGAFGSRATVDCFEPNPALFGPLERRFSRDSRVACHPLALGRRTETTKLHLDHAGSSRASLEPQSFEIIDRPIGTTFEVRVTTLDEFVSDLIWPRIDLLKLDVEGHEVAVLEGARKLLADGRIGVVQFEFGEANLASRTFLRDFVRELGQAYHLFRVGPRGLVRLQYRPKYEVFAGETNYVALPREMAGFPTRG